MSHSTFLLIFEFLTLMILSIHAQYQPNRSSHCQVNGIRGRCIRVNNCPLVATMLQQSLSRTTSYLRDNYCGFDGSKPLVCCISEYQLLQAKSTGIPTNNSSGICHVNGQEGNCVLVNNCALVKALLWQSRERGVSYLKQNVCSLNNSKKMVCCVSFKTYFMIGLFGTAKNSSTGGSENSSPQDGNVPTVDVSSNPYLPNVCGRDLSVKNLSSSSTVLGEFPWMVLLEYQTPNRTITACSGALINRRYILTAATCIINRLMWEKWNLTSVRLGEHNKATEIDCDENDDQSSEQCADRPISVGIEEHIVHENYVPSGFNQLNDIALLRLYHDVPFTKFIRPICLPTTSYVSDKLYVAGWRKKFFISNIKSKLSLLLVDKMKCQQIYSNMSINLGVGQMCAGGQGGKDACVGESGSPLMSFEILSDGTDRWTAVGILAFGPHPCGLRNIPDVYTKVSQYVPWILSKIRA